MKERETRVADLRKLQEELKGHVLLSKSLLNNEEKFKENQTDVTNLINRIIGIQSTITEWNASNNQPSKKHSLDGDYVRSMDYYLSIS
jgi:hypothetical protein